MSRRREYLPLEGLMRTGTVKESAVEDSNDRKAAFTGAFRLQESCNDVSRPTSGTGVSFENDCDGSSNLRHSKRSEYNGLTTLLEEGSQSQKDTHEWATMRESVDVRTRLILHESKELSRLLLACTTADQSNVAAKMEHFISGAVVADGAQQRRRRRRLGGASKNDRLHGALSDV